MKRHCHYKQFVVVLHAMVYTIIITSVTTHPHKKTITNMKFNKGFHKDPYAFNC